MLQLVVRQLYPVSESIRPALEKMQEMFQQANFWPLVLVIAVAQAICEELAFRGFILSGFRHVGHKWRAIIYSALFFGLTHGILQQSLIACLLGTILGYLAVQSGSILPGMVFHVVHNTLAVANARLAPGLLPDWPLLVVGTLGAVLLLMRFGRLSSPPSPEEALEEAIERGWQPV